MNHSEMFDRDKWVAIAKRKGKTEETLAKLGLTRSRLKSMERKGEVKRVYVPTESGHRVMWLNTSKGGDSNGNQSNG